MLATFPNWGRSTINVEYFLKGRHNEGRLVILDEFHYQSKLGPTGAELYLPVKKTKRSEIPPEESEIETPEKVDEYEEGSSKTGSEFNCPVDSCIKTYKHYGNLLRHIDF